jgi:hypothetical protein
MTKKITAVLAILGLFSFTTTEVDKWMELKDNQKVDDYYRKDDQIFCGEVACKVKPMSGIDITALKVRPWFQIGQ